MQNGNHVIEHDCHDDKTYNKLLWRYSQQGYVLIDKPDDENSIIFAK